MYMRVAPELFLKKMIVGQFGKVFELGKNFRNEGVDLTHNPEFTSCEFYWAYADMFDVMALTEELVSSLVKELTGSYKTKFTTQHGETYEVNWEAPWRKVEMIPELEKATGEKFPPYDELHTDETNQFLQRVCKKMGVECPPPLTNARMIDKLTGEFIEETCVNPTFIRGCHVATNRLREGADIGHSRAPADDESACQVSPDQEGYVLTTPLSQMGDG